MSPVDNRQAEWIGVIGGSKPNTWICYRKQFDLVDKPAEAFARITCDSKYWLWIHEELAVFEGQLKRGPTPHDTYFDNVDLTSYFRRGTNTVAILVNHFGQHGFSHNSSGKAALLFDAKIDGKPLLSDDEQLNQLWKESLRTLYVTMRDTYMDCPDRERAQWWGDAVNEIGEAFYALNAQRAPLLASKAIHELIRWQRDENIFPPLLPNLYSRHTHV